MNVSRRVYEAVPEDLIFVHVVRALHQLGANLAIVLEVGILAGQFVLVPRNLSEELRAVQHIGEGFLPTSRLQKHQDVTHANGFLMLLLQTTGLVVGVLERVLGCCKDLQGASLGKC